LLFLLCLTIALAQVSRQNLTVNGPSVSRIMLGTLNLPLSGGAQAASVLIKTAFAQGIDTYDLAVIYDHGGARMVFGQAVALLQQSDPNFRSKIQVVAKMGLVFVDGNVTIDTSIDGLNNQLNDYLKEIPGNYVDFVVLHTQDVNMDVAGVAQLWCTWLSLGKTRYFGVSNHDGLHYSNFDAALRARCKQGLVTNEIEISTLNPSHDTYGRAGGFPQADYHYFNGRVACLAWGPEGGAPDGTGNRLFGNAGSAADHAKAALVRPVLEAVGMELGATPDLVELAFLLKYPSNIVPIIGTIKPERVITQTKSESVAAKMTIEQWQRIATVADAHGTVPWPPGVN